MAVTFRPFYCLVLRFEGGECVVGMVLVVNAGTYGMALGSGLNIDVRHCAPLIAWCLIISPVKSVVLI
jgi:hypothetical protein